MRVPYDSLTLAAVVQEVQPYVGGKLQRVVQPDPLTLCLGLYRPGGEGVLMISADADFARAHFVTKRARNSETIFALLQALRARVEGSVLTSAKQVGFDRILELNFEHPNGRHRLVAELMGKHAKIMLLDDHDRVLACAKTVPASQSKRAIVPGGPYVPPPFEPRPSLLKAGPGKDLKQCEGASPFLLKWVAANSLEAVQNAVRNRIFQPIYSPGNGAYPLSVASLGLSEMPRSSISIALENHHELAVLERATENLRRSLASQLSRVILAREVALNDLDQARDAAANAGKHQLLGELILAYQGGIQPNSSVLEAWDYAGNPLEIRLLPDLTPVENANRYFQKAKHAKSRASLVEEQYGRISEDLADAKAVLLRIETAADLGELEHFKEIAKGKRWLHIQSGPPKAKEDRPYEGHRIRELAGPQGFAVLYGETAEANDYLTMRVAKSNDWWLHIRGGVSAHVIVRTQNQPDRVSREALIFAAKVAVQNSPSKHAGLVAVDYTLKKYVRKPKGAPKGTALYTHEKTLHVEN